MAYKTLPVIGDFNGTNELTSTNRPTGVAGLGIKLPGGGFRKLIGIANLNKGTAATPGPGTSLADTDGLPEGTTNLYFTPQRVADKADKADLVAFRDTGLVMRKPSGQQVPLLNLPTALNWVAGSTLCVLGQINLPNFDYNFPGPGTLYLAPGSVLTLNKLRPPNTATTFKISGSGVLNALLDIGPDCLHTLVEYIDFRHQAYLYSFQGGPVRRFRMRNVRQTVAGTAIIVDYGNGGFYNSYATVELTSNDITTTERVIRWFDQISDPLASPAYVLTDSAAQAANQLILSQNTITAPAGKLLLDDSGGRVTCSYRSNTYRGLAPPTQANTGISSDEAGNAGAAGPSTFSYAARRYEAASKVQLQNAYYYGIPCTLTLPGSAAAYTNGASGNVIPSGIVIPADGYYGLKGHAHMVFPNMNVYAECFFYLNNDGNQLITFSQITPRDAGSGLILGTEQLAVDTYLTAGTTVHLGYSDSSAGAMYPRNDAPAASSKMSIIRLA